MKVNIRMIRNMVMENSNGLMEEYELSKIFRFIKETG